MTREQNFNVAIRERLLDTAEILFAQRGFDGVTVREITRKAHCNQAAVNYYFRSKKNLYLELNRFAELSQKLLLTSYLRV